MDGFSVSSANDLKKIRKKTHKDIHFISPLIRKVEIDAVNSMGSSVTFNSLEQLNRYKDKLSSDIKVFLRVNPEMSFLDDQRHDPSRHYSKLGVPISMLAKHIRNNHLPITGIHFHNNCQSEKPEQLIKVLDHIEINLKSLLRKIQYLNLGGGYIFSKTLMDIIVCKATDWKKRYDINFIMEPSFDISNNAGFLASSVIDLFRVKDKNIAVLDTTVNHIPEVFEYQCKPEILGHCKENDHSYILAGATCLAGDVFGEYYLKEKLKLNDKIIFKNVGAYSHIKANKFKRIGHSKSSYWFI